MKHLNNCLSANDISLNAKKTELVIFKSPRQLLQDEIKIKLSGKWLYPSNSIKYLGVRIDSYIGMIKWIALQLNLIELMYYYLKLEIM